MTRIIAKVTYGILPHGELEKIIAAEEKIAEGSVSNIIYNYLPFTTKLPLASAKKQRESKRVFEELGKYVCELRKKIENEEYDESTDAENASFLQILLQIAAREKIPFTNEEVCNFSYHFQ